MVRQDPPGARPSRSAIVLRMPRPRPISRPVSTRGANFRMSAIVAALNDVTRICRPLPCDLIQSAMSPAMRSWAS